MTTSGTSNTFSNVSLGAPVRPLYAGENTAMGGLEENKLKKLKGERLGSPLLLMVLAKQMGRGAMAFCRYFCRTGTVRSLGLMLNMERRYDSGGKIQYSIFNIQ